MRLDEHVHRRQRPGYPSREHVPKEEIDRWIEKSREDGIERVIVLLSEEELMGYYDNDLLERYRSEFGGNHVLHAPIKDHSACSPEQLHDEVLPFLGESVKKGMRVAVHCSAGIGRTGQVLFAWMVHEHDAPTEDAMSKVRGVGCDPLESLTQDELYELVEVE